MLSALYTRLKLHKLKCLQTGTDPETQKTAGVGTISNGRIPITKLQPQSKRMKDLVGGGRIQFTGLSLPGNITLVICNLYLWTNGHTDPTAAFRSDDMLAAVFKNSMSCHLAPN